jgi:EF-hand fold domain/STATa Immunoglobulin-like domain
LNQLVTQQKAQCYAALVIAQQCFPMVLTKRKAGIIKKDTSDDAPTVVRLLLGASARIQSMSEVTATVMFDAPPPVAKGKNAAVARRDLELDHVQLQPDQSGDQESDSMSGEVNLVFLNGTRKAQAQVKFSVELRTTDAPEQLLRLESHPTRPLVVITNECQFEESDGLLLRNSLFPVPEDGGAPEHVPWFFVANRLQLHFLRATRQELGNPNRYITRPEFDYMHRRFFEQSSSISVEQFDTFWNWFGKTVQKIRYTRSVSHMWQSGLIYPFTGRDQISAALQQQETGVFLVRLSERVAGSFIVAYTIDVEEHVPTERVRHYLLKPEDVHPKKSLPEFLIECPQFMKLLQVSFDELSGAVRHRIVDKELVLEPFGTKKPRRAKAQDTHGYDVQLINATAHLNLSGGTPAASPITGDTPSQDTPNQMMQ